MTLPMLTEVQWKPHRFMISVLLFALLLCNVEYTKGAPSAQFGQQGSHSFSSAQGKQNPSEPFGHFNFKVDDDDSSERHFRSGTRGRNSPSDSHFTGTSAASQSFGVPLSAAKPDQISKDSRTSFGIPLPNSQPGHRSEIQPSVGVPLSSTQNGHGSRASQSFGVPLPSTQNGHVRNGPSVFGTPLSAVETGQGSQDSSAFGVPLSATQSGTSNARFDSGSFPSRSTGFTVERESLEDVDDDDDDDDFTRSRGRSHISPTHTVGSNIQRNRGRFSFDDDVSFEDIDSSNEFMSLGRRFHPMGIPKRSEPLVTSFNAPSSTPTVIANPFIVTSDKAFGSDESIEDDDDIVVLSPLIKAYNHRSDNERLSLAKDFMNQYNFVDVKGSTNWGYSTKDQYQEHKLHSDGAMEGKFGWTAPEGSQVNIEYVADKGGYRVVSSTGLYTKDAEDVLRQKEIHFAEHDKAKKNHDKVVNDRRRGHKNNFGVPLPTPTLDSANQGQLGSGAFVVVRDDDDDDDFPLVHSDPSVGVPLPGEVGVFVDTTASGVPLPTAGQEHSPGFGIPLPSPGSDGAAVSSGTQDFGIPLPGFGNGSTNFGIHLPGPLDPTGLSESSSATGTSGFGIPLPQPETPSSGTDSVPGFGIPLPGSETGSGDQSHTSGTPGFGVPLPGSETGTGDQSIISKTPGFGIPLPGSETTSGDQSLISGTPGFGVPLPGSVTGSGDQSTTSGAPGFGVPLPGSATGSGDQSFISGTPAFGVPIPKSETGSGDQSFISGTPGFGVPLPESETGAGDQSLISGTPGFGIPLPGSETGGGDHSTFPGTPSFGVPLSGSKTPSFGVPLSGSETPSFGFPLSGSETPSFGVPLSGSGTPSDSHGFGIPIESEVPVSSGGISPSPGFGIPLPESAPSDRSRPSFSSGGSVFGVNLPESVEVPSINDQRFGVSLSETTSGVRTAEPSLPSADQGVGVSLPDFSSAGGESFSPNLPTQDTSVPLHGEVTPFDSGRPIDSTQNQGFGISLQDVNQSGQGTSFLSGQGFGIPLGTTQTDKTQFGGQSFPSSNKDSFGVPLSSSGVGSTNFVQDLGKQSPVGASLPSRPTHEKASDSDFGVGFKFSNEEKNQFDINVQPPRSDFGGPFGVPLNLGPSAEKSSDTGAPVNEFNSFSRDRAGQDKRINPGIKLQFDNLNAHGRGSTFESEVDPSSFGIVSSENIKSQGDLSSQGILESTSSTKFSNNDPHFGAPSVGIPLSSSNAFSSNIDSTSNTPSEPFSSGNTGISLFSNLDSTAPHNTNVDLLQGPPFGQIGAERLDPCLNSKIHPSLLPPECFEGANDVQPNQKIGKSLSETNKNRAEDSFIVVVNSDLFQ